MFELEDLGAIPGVLLDSPLIARYSGSAASQLALAGSDKRDGELENVVEDCRVVEALTPSSVNHGYESSMREVSSRNAPFHLAAVNCSTLAVEHRPSNEA